MAREDSFGFTHLVEEDDEVPGIGGSYVDLELQPHLSTYNKSKNIINADIEATETKWQQPTFQGLLKADEKVGNKLCVQNSNESGAVVEAATNTRCNVACTEASINLESSNLNSGINSSNTNGVSRPAEERSMVPIQYSATEGKVNVMQGQLETRSDGSQYIDTQGIPQHWLEFDRPLRQRKIKLLQIFSIIACFAFFPFGILAAYFAFRTEAEFNEGIMKGNIDRAQKFAKRTERLIIISFIMFLVIVILVVIVAVRSNNSSTVPRGPVMG